MSSSVRMAPEMDFLSAEIKSRSMKPRRKGSSIIREYRAVAPCVVTMVINRYHTRIGSMKRR